MTPRSPSSSGSSCAHIGRRQPQQIEAADQVDADNLFERGKRHRPFTPDDAPCDAHTGAIHQHPRRPVRLARFRNGGFGGCGISDIAGHAEPTDTLRARLDRLPIDVEHRHAAAGTCESLCGRSPQPGGTAGDDGRLSVETHCRIPREMAGHSLCRIGHETPDKAQKVRKRRVQPYRHRHAAHAGHDRCTSAGQDGAAETVELGAAGASAQPRVAGLGRGHRQGIRRHDQVHAVSVGAVGQGDGSLRHGARRHRRLRLCQSRLSAGSLPDHCRGRTAVPGLPTRRADRRRSMHGIASTRQPR